MTGKPRSAKETLTKLRKKQGQEFELWRQEIFRFGLAELTDAEAKYLLRAESFDTIRNRIIKAAEQGK